MSIYLFTILCAILVFMIILLFFEVVKRLDLILKNQLGVNEKETKELLGIGSDKE